MARVSVICPVYCHTEAHRSYLRETLESVAAQTYRDMELVIVDDVSPMDITPIVDSVGDLPPTTILRNVTNLRHAESRNVGIRAADSELVAFIDHDDLWKPEKLARQVQALDEHPEASMVFCDVEIIGDYPQGLYTDQKTVPELPSLGWLVTHNNCVITVSSVLVRRQAMLDIGLFDSRYSSCDDFDAWIKLRTRAPIVHLRETLASYRLHEHNVNYTVDRLTDNRLLTALLWRTACELGPVDRMRLAPVLAKKLAGRLVWTIRRKLGK